MPSPDRPPPLSKSEFTYLAVIPTRWADNDLYGHVNNVVYYSYFDTAIAGLLMSEGGLDPWKSEIIGVVVENGCKFHRSVAYPDTITAGVTIAHIGSSSVRYMIGIFRNDEESASAEGHFVHVFVDRASQRPVSIPEQLRRALEKHHRR